MGVELLDNGGFHLAMVRVIVYGVFSRPPASENLGFVVIIAYFQIVVKALDDSMRFIHEKRKCWPPTYHINWSCCSEQGASENGEGNGDGFEVEVHCDEECVAT